MSTPIVPSDAPHDVKYDRPTETYRVLNAAGIIVDRYQHDSGDFSGRRAMYRLALEDAAVRDAAAAQAEARAWADEQAAASAMDAALDLTCACQICGGAVLPDQACLVGEHMACPHCEAEAYYASPAEDAPASDDAGLDLDAQLALDMRAAYDAAPTVPVALTTEPTPANVGEAVVAQWFGEWCEARALGEPQAWIDGKLQAIRTLGYYVVRPAGVGPWHLAAAVDGVWRVIATEPTPAAPSLMDVFTLSDQAWSAAIARYAPTPRRSFIAHELPAFVEELRGLLAYLPDGGVWQSANGDIRLVQAPTRYAAALAAAEHYEVA